MNAFKCFYAPYCKSMQQTLSPGRKLIILHAPPSSNSEFLRQALGRRGFDAEIVGLSSPAKVRKRHANADGAVLMFRDLRLADPFVRALQRRGRVPPTVVLVLDRPPVEQAYPKRFHDNVRVVGFLQSSEARGGGRLGEEMDFLASHLIEHAGLDALRASDRSSRGVSDRVAGFLSAVKKKLFAKK